MSRFRDGRLRVPWGLAVALAASLAAPAAADPLGLGREATPDEVAAWDIDIRPDGQGLPPGEGDVATGEAIYTERCASCHGVFGEGEGRWPVLMGGEGTLDRSRPVRTVGSYWPYASTIWDYVHRAMPFGDARSLDADETYAVAAYLLYLNDIVGEDFVATPASYAAVTMPNADGFEPDDRDATELPAFGGEVCMTGCKESVEITMRAAVLDVTPEVGAADLGSGAAVEGSDHAAEAVAVAADPALVAEGADLFRRCRSCHQVGPGATNRVGPHLNGVVGRDAASVEGFRYSATLDAAGGEGLVWDAASLAEFLSDPKVYLPGTEMAFPGLRPEEAQAMVAWLGSLDGG